MTNLSRLCIFLLVAAVCIAGCARQTPSLLHDPNPEDAPLPPFSTPVTREEVRAAFQKYSAPAIVNKLMENEEANWRMIMEKIAEGDAEWIFCATVYIKPGTDAETSKEFTDALAYALQHNPKAVLSLDGGIDIPMSRVCSLPFVEPEYEFVKSYGQKALAALRNVDGGPHSLELRDICIRRLQRQLDIADKMYREGRWHY